MCIASKSLFFLLIGISSFALADEIPIEDLSSSANNSQSAQTFPSAQTAKISSAPLSLEQRIEKLEEQTANLSDLSGKVDDLQQQVQKLRGDVEVQQHDIKLLHDQLRNYYQDVDQRLSQASPSSKNNAGTTDGSPKDTDIKSANSLTETAKPVSESTSEQKDYQDGLDALKAKKYDDSINKMQAYLHDYPNGKYAANAHYWLGEIYYTQAQPAKATKEFQTILNVYPDSPKVPDAMLKLGMIYNDRGEYDKAYKEFQQVKKKYPESSAAQLVDQLQPTKAPSSKAN